MREFGKGGGDEIQSERVVNQVVYDAPFGDNLFALQFSELPAFSDISGNPLVAAEPAPESSSQVDPLGQAYFFITDHNHGMAAGRLMNSIRMIL